MITMISERTKGGYNPSPGVIYPALDLLQDLGWATVSEEGDKKLYSLTSDGKAALAENTERVSAINERLARFAGETGGNSAHTVKTAFQRLRHEIRGSLSSETTDEVKRETIINLINQAREDIAKLG
jgi:DNA-binding PadR family transcriptional regulator